jgi:UDP-N-acetylmuramoylalanine--D-glutamate ligase
VLLVGQAAGDLGAALSGLVPVEDCGTVRRAVESGFSGAEPGDVVLLAPACASFDQYRNFEERGADFRGAVAALRERGGGDA